MTVYEQELVFRGNRDISLEFFCSIFIVVDAQRREFGDICLGASSMCPGACNI